MTCERCDYPLDGDHDCGKVIEMAEQADAYRDALLGQYGYDCAPAAGTRCTSDDDPVRGGEAHS